MRSGSGDGNEEDGGEVGGHQLAQDSPSQMDCHNNPSLARVGGIAVVERPVSDGVNWDPVSFLHHIQKVRNESDSIFFKMGYGHFDMANLRHLFKSLKRATQTNYLCVEGVHRQIKFALESMRIGLGHSKYEIVPFKYIHFVQCPHPAWNRNRSVDCDLKKEREPLLKLPFLIAISCLDHMGFCHFLDPFRIQKYLETRNRQNLCLCF